MNWIEVQFICLRKKFFDSAMDLSVVPVSDNSISSIRPVHCDIDKLVNEIEELNDEFADHLYSIIKLRSRCEKLIELKPKHLEVDDDIRRQISVVRNVVQESTVGDQLDSMLKIMLRLVSDVPTIFP